MAVALIALALAGTHTTSLSIRFWPDGPSGPLRAWTLRCDPIGGTLPGRATACRRLNTARGNPFAETPPRTACSQIYGGPQEAVVRGTFRGRPVRTRFTRRDGCAVDRWNRVAFLFPTQARR